MQEKNIEAKTHGRYLVEASTSGAPMLVGFHGYAELADVEFDRLRKIDGADQWTVVAIQALHRFYRGRSRDVVASWLVCLAIGLLGFVSLGGSTRAPILHRKRGSGMTQRGPGMARLARRRRLTP